MKILGIIVLYYPDEQLFGNILTYLRYLDKLIIWENTPHNSQNDIYYENEFLQNKILKWSENSNVGLGVPFNKAVAYGMREGFTHLLTMDQDSFFKNNDFEKYINFVKSRPNDNSSCFYIPNYLVNETCFYSQDSKYEYVESYMTSGTIYPISLFNKIGLFREDFFVDTIDVEYGLRARKNKIIIIAVHFVILHHGAGYQRKKRRFLWKIVFPNEYSASRSYYIIRNALITYKEYPDPQNKRKYLWYWFYKRLAFVVLYESNKFKKIKALLLGYYHGMIGILGKQNIFDEK